MSESKVKRMTMPRFLLVIASLSVLSILNNMTNRSPNDDASLTEFRFDVQNSDDDTKQIIATAESDTKRAAVSTSSSTIHTQKHNLPKTRALIYMGIPKTGSTTIELLSKTYQKHLELDGYEMPWVLYREAAKTDNRLVENPVLKTGHQMPFAACFLNVSQCERSALSKHPCNKDLLRFGSDIAKRKKNLLVTAESFVRIQREGIKALAEYLSSRWDEIIIVVYYRRFYDWLASLYNQIYKRTGKGNNVLTASAKRENESINDFLALNIREPSSTKPTFTYFLVERLQEHFHKNQILVMNFNDKSMGGVDESFYCHAMPNAPNTCNAIRRKGGTIFNAGQNTFDYEDLLYVANKTGLVHIKNRKDFEKKWKQVQRYQENVLNKTSSNFKRLCPSADVLNKLWEFTLTAERSLFPDKFFKDENYIVDMKSEFDEAARTNLCKVDAEATLKEDSWKKFFKTMKKFST